MSNEPAIRKTISIAFMLSIMCLAAPAWADFKAGVDADNDIANFTGSVVRFLDGTPLKSCRITTLNASV